MYILVLDLRIAGLANPFDDIRVWLEGLEKQLEIQYPRDRSLLV